MGLVISIPEFTVHSSHVCPCTFIVHLATRVRFASGDEGWGGEQALSNILNLGCSSRHIHSVSVSATYCSFKTCNKKYLHRRVQLVAKLIFQSVMTQQNTTSNINCFSLNLYYKSVLSLYLYHSLLIFYVDIKWAKKASKHTAAWIVFFIPKVILLENLDLSKYYKKRDFMKVSFPFFFVLLCPWTVDSQNLE